MNKDIGEAVKELEIDLSTYMGITILPPGLEHPNEKSIFAALTLAIQL